MSHGNAEKCEPSFTPLLDLVLQLVMFFMISANFVMEQADAQVKLPEAVAAKALPAKAEEIIFLNVNAQGQVLLPPIEQVGDEKTLDNPVQVEGYLKRLATISEARHKKKKPEATLILRVDRQTPFEKSYPIMKACRNAGYSDVQLRAIRHSGPDS
jgi:biopolymer transport protein ExbD